MIKKTVGNNRRIHKNPSIISRKHATDSFGFAPGGPYAGLSNSIGEVRCPPRFCEQIVRDQRVKFLSCSLEILFLRPIGAHIFRSQLKPFRQRCPLLRLCHMGMGNASAIGLIGHRIALIIVRS